MEENGGWADRSFEDFPGQLEQGFNMDDVLGQTARCCELQAEGHLSQSLPPLSGIAGRVAGEHAAALQEPKPRLRWTPELHQRFLSAANKLGGPLVATPKQILVQMAVPGVTLRHVKSHLQKYRTAISGEGWSKGQGSKRSRRGVEGGDSESDEEGRCGEEPQRRRAIAREGPAAAAPQAPAGAQAAAAAAAAGRPLLSAAEDAQQIGVASSPVNSGRLGVAGGLLWGGCGERQPYRELPSGGSPPNAERPGQCMLRQPAGGARSTSGQKGTAMPLAAEGTQMAGGREGAPVLQLAAPQAPLQPCGPHPLESSSGEGITAVHVGGLQHGGPEAAARLPPHGREAGAGGPAGGADAGGRMQQALAAQRELQGQLQEALEAQSQLQGRMMAHGKLLQSLLKGVGGSPFPGPGPAGRIGEAKDGPGGLTPEGRHSRHSSSSSSSVLKGKAAHSMQSWGPAREPTPRSNRFSMHQPEAGAAGPAAAPLAETAFEVAAGGGPGAASSLPGSPKAAAWQVSPTQLLPHPPPPQQQQEQPQQLEAGTEQVQARPSLLPPVLADPARILARLAHGLPVHELELAALQGPASSTSPSQATLWAPHQPLQQPRQQVQQPEQQRQQQPSLQGMWDGRAWEGQPTLPRCLSPMGGPGAQHSPTQAGMGAPQSAGAVRSATAGRSGNSGCTGGLPGLIEDGMPSPMRDSRVSAGHTQPYASGAAERLAHVRAAEADAGGGPPAATAACGSGSLESLPSTSALAALDELLEGPGAFEGLLDGSLL